MAIDELTKIEVILTVVEMFTVVLIASFILVRIWYDYRFHFLMLLSGLLIVTDISGALYAVGQGMENTIIQINRTKGLAIEVGITTFLFNAGFLLIHWLFSFKYFVISTEIPKVI